MLLLGDSKQGLNGPSVMCPSGKNDVIVLEPECQVPVQKVKWHFSFSYIYKGIKT